MSEAIKQIARRFRQELWNTGHAAIADEICAPSAALHVLDPVTPDFGRGPEALKKVVGLYLKAFPDARCTIEDLIVEGDRVAVRWSARATHRGPLGEIPATGKSIEITGIDILRVSGGRIEEMWTNWDTLGLLRQVGATEPQPASSGRTA